ncbi:serine-type carboxypeptidase Ecym_1217 [Eremothecium cymbalariae DBVPG|uniref:Carboxypeptidase n=1 Tax=Eremothecium cymbalariae (strain CBS 270.75 / DBVPG 7215 / KCTC 17166 / NRRL Y-17582) TaxID=931890 RepID=G8JN00_ERECY|nr:hypothetical protein Ecym_1217 [Eremothecium cymbalariae DBVPG\
MQFRRVLVMTGVLASQTQALRSQEEYRVASELLPGVSQLNSKLVPEMHAGQLPLRGEDEDGKRLFFWRYAEEVNVKDNRSSSDTLIMWFNGGPGCSSMDGALMELGPFRIDASGKVILNEGSWHTRADLLFVDQPVGTGLSARGRNGKYDNDLLDVADDFIKFLENYYAVFPQDRNKKLILTGESYAGQYVPYFAQAILLYNKRLVNEGKVPLDLTGMMIGNGWIDPDHQSLSYLPFLMDVGLIHKEDSFFPDALKSQEACQNKINQQNGHFSNPECDQILDQLASNLRNQSAPENQRCLNFYDYRIRDSYPSCGVNWPPDLPHVTKFFNTPGVLEALNIAEGKSNTWEECSNDVYNALSNPRAVPAVDLLPGLLDAGLELILYSGDKDIICNGLGVEQLIHDLKWGGSTGFTQNVHQHSWVHEYSGSGGKQEPAGFIQTERNLTFITVYNASHMVPLDVPNVSRGLIDIYRNRAIDQLKLANASVIITQDSLEDSKVVEKARLFSAVQARNDGIFEHERHGRFTFSVICLAIFSFVGVTVYYSMFGTQVPNILRRSHENVDAGKVVTECFEDDIELGITDFSAEEYRPKNNTRGMKKNGYVSLNQP